ncbi:HEXXH motif domain-containing protein [Actinomadura sp. KC345]|uniref:HEXXH motif domain-containing protein n=1 Tax=Actinomadura sp. KC345 TaxID=2530371 RepID=UPI001404EC43|nr:HEXXH motif domain-containing protein [Actinomadura sp. KC345]
MSGDDLRALAGRPGETGGHAARAVAALVRAQRRKQLVRLRLVRDHARRLGGHEGALRAYAILAELHGGHPDAVDEVALHPAVRAWASATLRALRGGPTLPGARPEGLASLAAAAMIRTGTPGELHVPVSAGGAMIPSLGRAATGFADTALVRFIGHGAWRIGDEAVVPATPRTDAPGWEGLRTLRASAHGAAIHPVLDDLDPFRMPGTEPAPRLTRPEVHRWHATFKAAWGILSRRHRGFAVELAALARALTPLAGGPPGHQSSASSPEAFGGVALSMPADAQTMALTLVHEVQHAKLTALMDTVPLTRPGGEHRYRPAWRSDPRPATATLHGTYAHLAVSEFWRAQSSYETGEAARLAHTEFARWNTASMEAAEALLDGDDLTPEGHCFVTEIRRTLHRRLASNHPSPGQAAADRRPVPP